jgi:hypothetical protein
MGIVFNCWFLEGCGPQVYFGPYSAMTQEVQIDPQIETVRRGWANAGYPRNYATSTSIDNRNINTSLGRRLISGGEAFAKEHGALGPVYLSGGFVGDRSAATGDLDGTGILGSFDRVSIYDAGNGRVLFEVMNRTGWASGTRIPGTDVSLIQDRAQSQWGPGGTFTQIYYWWESFPQE